MTGHQPGRNAWDWPVSEAQLMTEQIKQPGNIARVLPLKRTRDTGRRKRPPQMPEKSDADKAKQRPTDDGSHHVDEYV